MHLTLKLTLQNYGAKIECLNYRFDDSAEGRFVEIIFAAQSELEAEQNRRQTMQKMQARLEAGHWLFKPPPGYKYQRAPSGGKILVRDELVASIVAEALECYTSGRFQTKAEVEYFLESFPEYPRGSSGTVHYQRVDELITRVISAGYLEFPQWDVSLRKAQHFGFISYETFLRLQERSKEGAK